MLIPATPEKWTDVIGYEGYYEVSNYGRVKSVDRVVVDSNGFEFFRKGKMLKAQRNQEGYMRVRLSRNGKTKVYFIHRLVLASFKGYSDNPDYNMVNHINGIKDDNTLSNLEWCDNQYNQLHSYKLGSLMYCEQNINAHCGEDNHNSTITEDDVKQIRELYATGNYTQLELSDMFNTDRVNVGRIINGKAWKHVR